MTSDDGKQLSILQLAQRAGQDNATELLESERQRIATLLQEQIVNQVRLILAQVTTYEQSLRGVPQAQMAMNVLSSLLRQLLQQARDLEDNLNPKALTNLGLESALEILAGQAIRSHGFQIHLQLQRIQHRLPTHLELALYRLTQDAIARMGQSTKARQATIYLEADDNEIRYRFEDDGEAPHHDTMRASRERLTGLGALCQMSQSRFGGMVIIVGCSLLDVTLTDREMAVIVRLVAGLTNKEIAYQLGVSPRTVKFHLDNIYSKLGINTRTEAAIYALRRGWLPQPD